MWHVGAIVLCISLFNPGAHASGSCPKLPPAPKKLADGRVPDEKFKLERARIIRELKRACQETVVTKENLERARADLVFAAGQLQEAEIDEEDGSDKITQARDTKIRQGLQLDQATLELTRLETHSSNLLKQYDRLLKGKNYKEPSRALASKKRKKKKR